MKRIIYILLVISIFVLIISIFIKPVIIFLAERQIARVFLGSRVSIRDCALRPLSQLSLLDLEINKGKIYNFKFKEIVILYSLPSILKRNISNSSLLDAIMGVDFKIDSLESQGFRLENASLNVSRLNDRGGLYINRLEYDKVKIKEIRSKARLNDGDLLLDSLSAKLLNGEVQGDLSLRIDKGREYLASLKFIDLDLETFVNDFNLNKKIQVTGKLGGTVTLKGAGLNIDDISGEFSNDEHGGRLVIRDTRFLENLAGSSKVPLDILVESFKDYHYNTGVMSLSLDKGNLILDITLDGETGSRNLNITVHDFKLRREEL